MTGILCFLAGVGVGYGFCFWGVALMLRDGDLIRKKDLP